MGVLRRYVFSLACLVLAGVVGLAAIADHRWKQARIDRAQVSEWYCEHLGTRCGGPSSAVIERHWNERQVGYEIAVVGLAALAVVRVAYRLARR